MIRSLKTPSLALLCLAYLSTCVELAAQYNNHLWFFGRGSTGVSFSMTDNSPKPHTLHSQLNGEGSCVVVNPYNKQLLFYSDGDKVYNSKHRIMPNGSGLGGCPSSAQAAAVVPKPGSSHQYYLFYNTRGSGCTTQLLKVVTIDMTLNGSLGDVIPYSSSILMEQVAEGMALVPEPNTENYWLIGNKDHDTYSHYVLHITPTGIALHDLKDYVSTTAAFNLNYHPSRKCISSIYKGDLQQIRLFDFDAETGDLSPHNISIPLSTPDAYDVEISPDGSKLYYSSWRKVGLFQCDLTTNEEYLLYDALDDDDSKGGGLAIGPDGKIYHIHELGSTTLAVVQNPDLSGPNCNYIVDGLELHSPIRTSNLPVITPYASSEPSLSGVINTYGSVIDWCGNTLEADQASQFSIGDTILIIQMQGAHIDTTNTASFGIVQDYGSAGLHELNIITDIQGETITLERPLQHEYDVRGNVQIVDRPYLGSTTIGAITCLPWNGKTGGVLAFSADQLELADHIDVSGRGFRGGQAQSDPPEANTSPYPMRTAFVYPLDSIDAAGEKGEGIAFLSSTIKRGKGSSYGGGGGNNHNAGGGGGANAGNGGIGGVWYGQDSAHIDANGLGGRLLNYDLTRHRLFLGGGGGAGHTNNYWATSGSNGGGIIFLSANRITHNHFRIKANGASVGMDYSNIFHDGGGGAGAGGSIALLLPADAQNDLILEVYGGFGGTSNRHGHGGGGGGGKVYMTEYENGGPLINAQGGLAGNDGHFNTATQGGNGRFEVGYEPPFGTLPFESLALDSIRLTLECDSSSSVLVIASGTNLSIKFGEYGWSTDSLFSDLRSGWHDISITNGCDTLLERIHIQNIPPLTGTIDYKIQPLCDSLGIVKYDASNGLPPYIYTLENTSMVQSFGRFQSLPPGNFQVTVTDQRGCVFSDSFSLHREEYELDIALPVKTKIQRYDTAHISPLPIAPFEPPFKYRWEGDRCIHCFDCEMPKLYPKASTTYYLTVTDYWGCTGTDSTRVIVEEPKLYIPNAFSPNGNGSNDTFTFYGGPGFLTPVNFEVYDRWGKLVFKGNGDNWSWNGYINNELAQPGIYTFSLQWLDKGNNKHGRHGEVNLVR